jgi:MFS family permease
MPIVPSSSKSVIKTYLTLTLFNTLAASLIWGINTLFLLNAGLNVAEAFIANAFFTAGMVIFEVPTGVIADTRGRQFSYMLGLITLAISTFAYLVMWMTHGPFIGWILASLALGLGFTFFSGATDAWLVDALKFTKYKGQLETVFSKAQVVGGIAMLSGSIIGGLIAQFTNLGVPYIIRVGLLIVTFVIAAIYMKDVGFKAERGENYRSEVKSLVHASVKYGLRNPRVRWVMLSAPFISGVSIYVFYALQPYLLQLYGDSTAYWVAGLTAAIAAAAQIAGGLTAPLVGRLFKRRTTALFVGVFISAIALLAMGLVANFYAVLALIVIWGLIAAAITPVRKTYMNNLIPSKQRATVLSFDSLFGSAGGVVSQPLLGKSADIWGYGSSYLIAGVIQMGALPFLLLAGHRHDSKDIKIPSEQQVQPLIYPSNMVK